jgi:hypothetical protein
MAPPQLCAGPLFLGPCRSTLGPALAKVKVNAASRYSSLLSKLSGNLPGGQALPPGLRSIFKGSKFKAGERLKVELETLKLEP